MTVASAARLRDHQGGREPVRGPCPACRRHPLRRPGSAGRGGVHPRRPAGARCRAHAPLLPPHRPWRPGTPQGGSTHGTGSSRRHPTVGVGRHDPGAGMSGPLRRRYERLLFTYPSAYRRAHGEEMISTLLEAARPDQRFPAPRETASLLLGGLRTRARQAARQSPRRLWTDGLQLGVLLIVLVNLGHALRMLFPLWIALVALGALAVLRGWTRLPSSRRPSPHWRRRGRSCRRCRCHGGCPATATGRRLPAMPYLP
jgi:hypothetical protein